MWGFNVLLKLSYREKLIAFVRRVKTLEFTPPQDYLGGAVTF